MLLLCCSERDPVPDGRHQGCRPRGNRPTYVDQSVQRGDVIYFMAIVKLRIEPTAVLLSMRVDEGVNTHLDPEGRRRGSVNGDGA